MVEAAVQGFRFGVPIVFRRVCRGPYYVPGVQLHRILLGLIASLLHMRSLGKSRGTHLQTSLQAHYELASNSDSVRGISLTRRSKFGALTFLQSEVYEKSRKE